jgi:hypothetical protein
MTRRRGANSAVQREKKEQTHQRLGALNDVRDTFGLNRVCQKQCGRDQGVAGRRFNARREREPIPLGRLETLKRKCADETQTDYYSRWTRWFLFDRLQEPVMRFSP